ncbi:hypothetical protein J6590_093732 [Homalodisca vitripennis]|nr:hypothetical protein J6590_093732 [Homalodisca vitripennis]
MGCMRDNVQPSVFITKLARFQRTTGAKISVVSCEQKAKRTLCNGLSHKEFIEELKRLVEKQTDPQDGQELATTSSPMVQVQEQSSNGSFKYNLNTSDSETPSFSGWNLSDIHRPVSIQLRTDLNNSNESLSASPGTPLNLLHNHPIDGLSLTLEELKPDFVALSKHKVSRHDIERVNVSNYKICASFARENQGAGE